jgi:leucyl aminopeptidase
MDVRTLVTAPQDLADIAADALILILPTDDKLWTLAPALADLVADARQSGDLELKAARTVCLHRPTGLKARRLVVGICGGDPGAFDARAWQAAVTACAAALKPGGTRQAVLAWGGSGDFTASMAEIAVRAVAQGQYVYRHTKPSAPAPNGLTKLQLAVTKPVQADVRAGIERGVALAAGIELTREVANRPGNHCTPTFLAEQATLLAQEHGLKVEVLDRKAIEKLGMGAFLAVAQGSDEPPHFIVLRYEGAPRKQAPVVLVGKGITFDTGGISIKPAAEMDEMKYDMGGAASVLGTFRAVAQLKPKVNLIGLIPTCENMPSGRAVKPGDVVTSLSGQTIEILNTDAEGRLILCDALTYAERFKPAAVVDIATLTGACVIALGHHRSGLFSADDALATGLLQAGETALDPAWRMPLDDEYDEGLKSHFADMANVGPRAGGAITAAMFLKRYAGAYRWAHLDIAGTAWKSGAAKGATGRPVPLLTHFVLSFAGR